MTTHDHEPYEDTVKPSICGLCEQPIRQYVGLGPSGEEDDIVYAWKTDEEFGEGFTALLERIQQEGPQPPLLP